MWSDILPSSPFHSPPVNRYTTGTNLEVSGHHPAGPGHPFTSLLQAHQNINYRTGLCDEYLLPVTFDTEGRGETFIVYRFINFFISQKISNATKIEIIINLDKNKSILVFIKLH